MRHLISVSFLSITLLISASVPTAAEDVPGVTDNQILVGMITDLTGPAAFLGQEISAGAQLYLKHVNSLGGVHGRKIRLIVEDDGYKPPRSVAAFRKLVDRDRVFCFTLNLGSSCNLAVFPLIKRERIPLVYPACFNTAMHTPPKRYVFAPDPDYAAQSWIMVKYIVEAEKAPSPRLAVVYQDDDFGRDGLRGLRDAAAHYGLPVVAEESHKRGAVDFSTQVLNLRQANPTHVILWTLVREAATVLKEAHRLGWHPCFIGGNPAADDKIIELAGDAAANFMAIGFFDLWENPPGDALKLYRRLEPESGSDRASRPFRAWAFGSAQILVEALLRAGRNLTREKLVEALESFRGWNGNLGVPVTYGPNLWGGKHTAVILTRADIARGILVRATDWITFDMAERIGNQ